MKPRKPIAWRARQLPSLTVRVVTSDNKVLASKTFRRSPAVNDGPEAIAPTVCSFRPMPGQVASVANVIDKP